MGKEELCKFKVAMDLDNELNMNLDIRSGS